MTTQVHLDPTPEAQIDAVTLDQMKAEARRFADVMAGGDEAVYERHLVDLRFYHAAGLQLPPQLTRPPPGEVIQ